MLNAKTNITTKTILEEEGLMSIEEACTYLAISRRTFELNVLPYINRYGSEAKWFYKKEELKSFFLATKRKAKLVQDFEFAK